MKNEFEKPNIKSVKITPKTSGCLKMKQICNDIQIEMRKIVTVKLKLNSENSKYSYFCIYNDSFINSDNKVCVCSDLVNNTNVIILSCIGELFVGSQKLLSKRSSITEKLNFQESMITLNFEFNFIEEIITIKDSKNNEIYKVPLPIGLEEDDENSEKSRILNSDEFFKNYKFSMGIMSCDLNEEDEDFICKLVS